MSFTGTTVGVSAESAGTSALCPATTHTELSPEVVYQWTPSASGTATFETCNATLTKYDTALYLRSAPCATGTELACDDNAAACDVLGAAGKGSKFTASVTVNTTVYIIVDGFNGAAGAYSLKVTPP